MHIRPTDLYIHEASDLDFIKYIIATENRIQIFSNVFYLSSLVFWVRLRRRFVSGEVMRDV